MDGKRFTRKYLQFGKKKGWRVFKDVGYLGRTKG